ncbi:MAG: acyl carrier protein [Candidatus Omnitrophica bacterium]|jgi:acyl carrier protein|nr:acyl carrier protein [Candidatus Omnitrophota bacterium]
MAKEKPAKKQASGDIVGDERKEIINIISKLAKIAEETIDKNSGMHFTESGIDSFALVEIIFEIENKFNINIPQDSLVTIKSVDDLVKLVKVLRKK